ncbi:hypothetical protein B296_00009070 [Ensete ventricosum]|uniref:Uncharacterized protein n=1 Tax=Ensete ventricosum TaxID=4639 RepID=A0A427B0P5_ENSVE|nr:hypothetical protein B296_00009070 [Ensete ventricosum]
MRSAFILADKGATVRGFLMVAITSIDLIVRRVRRGMSSARCCYWVTPFLGSRAVGMAGMLASLSGSQAVGIASDADAVLGISSGWYGSGCWRGLEELEQHSGRAVGGMLWGLHHKMQFEFPMDSFGHISLQILFQLTAA